MQLERKRLTDQIIDRLVDMIEKGNFKPGDKLPPEPELMELFGVGRSSIREAINALSLFGLLTVRPGQGTHVAVFSEEHLAKPLGLAMLTIGKGKVRELIEARIAIEDQIVRLAAMRAAAEDIRSLRKYNAELKVTGVAGRKAARADLVFHEALAKICANRILMRLLAELRQPIRRWMEQKSTIDWGYDKVGEEHDRIIEAIEAHDVESASAALRKHLEFAGEKLSAVLLEREP